MKPRCYCATLLAGYFGIGQIWTHGLHDDSLPLASHRCSSVNYILQEWRSRRWFGRNVIGRLWWGSTRESADSIGRRLLRQSCYSDIFVSSKLRPLWRSDGLCAAEETRAMNQLSAHFVASSWYPASVESTDQWRDCWQLILILSEYNWLQHFYYSLLLLQLLVLRHFFGCCALYDCSLRRWIGCWFLRSPSREDEIESKCEIWSTLKASIVD